MGKVWKSVEKYEIVVKREEKWLKLGKVVEKWRKVRISGESWGKKGQKVGKSGIFFAKWPPAAILDDQKSLSIAFLAISDQYAAILEVPFGPFWMTGNNFRSHFSPFQINTQLFFF